LAARDSCVSPADNRAFLNSAPSTKDELSS
jgi:hypothetical protein